MTTCSKARFYYYNLIEQDQTVLSATSEDSNYPLENIKNPLSTKVFKSTSSSCSITIDTVTREPITSLLIVPSLEGFGFSGDVTVEANQTSNFASPAFSSTLAVDRKFNFGSLTFTENDYRFWRLTFNGASYVEVANIFLGRAFIPGKNFDFNWSYSEVDTSDISTNRYQQRYIDKINSIRQISGNIRFLTAAEMGEMYDFWNEVKLDKPFWMIMDPDEIFSPDKDLFSGRFYFRSEPDFVNVFFGHYNTSIRTIECI